MSRFSDLSPQAMERKMKQAKVHLDPQQLRTARQSLPQVHQALAKNCKNKEKSYIGEVHGQGHQLTQQEKI